MPDNCPQEFICPISFDVMKNPTDLVVSDGRKFTFEREEIETWLATCIESRHPKTNPLTNEELGDDFRLQANNELRQRIERWMRSEEDNPEDTASEDSQDSNGPKYIDIQLLSITSSIFAAIERSDANRVLAEANRLSCYRETHQTEFESALRDAMKYCSKTPSQHNNIHYLIALLDHLRRNFIFTDGEQKYLPEWTALTACVSLAIEYATQQDLSFQINREALFYKDSYSKFTKLFPVVEQVARPKASSHFREFFKRYNRHHQNNAGAAAATGTASASQSVHTGNTQTSDLTSKLLILGSNGVGKSTFLHYIKTKDDAAASAVDRHTQRVVHTKTQDGQEHKFVISKVEYDRRGNNMRSAARGTHGYFILFDLCDQTSFDTALLLLNDARRNCNYLKDGEATPIVLIGTKWDDVANRVVEKSLAQSKAAEHHIQYYEVDTLSRSANLEDTFNHLVDMIHERKVREQATQTTATASSATLKKT